MTNKLGYYICLFLYSLKEKQVFRNTLFRYVYIYNVVNDYLGNNEIINNEIIIDKDRGLGNVMELTEALNEINRRNYITICGSLIKVEGTLLDYIDSIKEDEKVKQDLNRVMYFVEIVSSYSEDVILSAFFSDPNIENAINRGKNEFRLSDNRLKSLLEEFESIANADKVDKLDKYDVFSSWLDFVLEEYLQEKNNE